MGLVSAPVGQRHQCHSPAHRPVMAAELRNLSNGEAVDQLKLRSAQTTTLDELGSDDVALDLVGALADDH